ncbi:MAG: NADH-quinone oxidoreductase subunit K [Rhodobacteraceae bacterium]|nr:NADH-quinone oxidoreductase subunit K [Paracoccaceae bacterium]
MTGAETFLPAAHGADVYALGGAVLVGLGVWGLLALRHLLRRVVAFNVIGSGIFLFFGAIAARGGGAPDPVPQALIITGIVVALSASALAVTLVAALAQRRGGAVLPGEGRQPPEAPTATPPAAGRAEG